MKFSLNEIAMLLGAIAPVSAQTLSSRFGQVPTGTKPMQTFFIPLPEQAMFDDCFKKVNSVATAPVTSLISFAISTDNTIIWYDHWEGGYETDILKPKSNTTQVWGNGFAGDGCAPDVMPCSDAADILKAGESIVIQNDVVLPRAQDNFDGKIFYDGGDMVFASFPIAITRGSYPKNPGSLMAGGVEVLDTDNWGTNYVAPVGENLKLPGSTSQFMQTEFTGLFIMAAEDSTSVTINGNSSSRVYINKGKSTHVRVKMGDRIDADKPVQVDLIAADLGSAYELRWFTLLPVKQWSNDYVTPVGDSFGSTKCALYNDNDSPLTINMTMRASSTAPITSQMVTVPAKGYNLSPVIPSGSGAQFKSIDSKNFLALSFTDSATISTDQATWTGGQWFDWGFPLQPTNLLTPQVLIGWGFGCTNNNCQGKTTRSVVWITPTENADFYIDYNNIGKDYVTRLGVNKLVGIKVTDEKDRDMSGAFIFATAQGSGVNGTPVDFAAAWGQDPSVSEPDQYLSLDLGTTVLPFGGIRISKVSDRTLVSAGDTLKYTIRILNVSPVDIPINEFKVVDELQYDQIYNPGSTYYSNDGGKTKTAVPDDRNGTAYPLDGLGLSNSYVLPRRGGVHEITFEVTIDSSRVNTTAVKNTGYMQRTKGGRYPFEAVTPLDVKAGIEVQNLLYLGNDGGASCNDTSKLSTLGVDVLGAPVTYCFKVTNIGKNYLKGPVLTNRALGNFTHSEPTRLLKPGDSYMVPYAGSITGKLPNVVQVNAMAVWANGKAIPSVNNVTDADDSATDVIPFAPSVAIDNKVFLNVGSCNASGVDQADGYLDYDNVTYCFLITNTGNTNLTNLKVNNAGLKPTYSDTRSAILKPGDSYLLTVPGKIDGNYTNMAIVTATPVRADGTVVPQFSSVNASDPSGITGKSPPTITSRSGGKDPFTPPSGGDPDIVTDCMDPHWRDGGGKQDLICRSDDIIVKKVTSNRAICKEGENVTITASAQLYFKKSLYDPAWFVATDGGDAKKGKCVLKGLVAGNTYTVTDPGGTPDVIGSVSWNSDNIGGNDKCGDVVVPGGSAIVDGPFLVKATLKCVDTNGDGSLDTAVCFSWREKADDGFCTLTSTDVDTKGLLADVFPANVMKCRCVIVDIPDVTVEKKTTTGVKTC